MLGQFLEFSIAAQPLTAAFEFYGSLGFQSIPVGDLLRDPYLCMYDGAVAVGLHEREHPAPVLTFVRPQLRDYARGIRRLGIALDYAHLKDDEFNRVGFADPNGQPVALLEARTFPPADWNRHNVTACGEFLEYSLAVDSLAESKAFWEGLGFRPVDAGEAPRRWLRLAGHGLVLGLHESHFRPGLSFRTVHLEARLEYLRVKGVALKAGVPFADPAQRAATLTAPDGTAIYLVESAPQ
jgi:catechol 2,3-dioxygenase-like lactoylglutathione lyase family enzyme